MISKAVVNTFICDLHFILEDVSKNISGEFSFQVNFDVM